MAKKNVLLPILMVVISSWLQYGVDDGSNDNCEESKRQSK